MKLGRKSPAIAYALVMLCIGITNVFVHFDSTPHFVIGVFNIASGCFIIALLFEGKKE